MSDLQPEKEKCETEWQRSPEQATTVQSSTAATPLVFQAKYPTDSQFTSPSDLLSQDSYQHNDKFKLKQYPDSGIKIERFEENLATLDNEDEDSML